MDKNIFYGTHNNFIYITEKEPINDRDWYLIPNTMMTPQTVRQFDERDFGDKEKALDVLNSLYGRKVVLTNDPNLIKDGVQKVSEDIMVWLAKNPCETIELVLNKKIYTMPHNDNFKEGDNVFFTGKILNVKYHDVPCKILSKHKTSSDIKDGLGHTYKVSNRELSLSSKNLPYNYLPSFIKQFDPGIEELNVDDWSALDFLKWLELNKFKIIK